MAKLRAKKTSRRATKKSAKKSIHKKPKISNRTQAPIELHFWPTPNGFKITVMLEECGLPYVIKPVNIGRGDQFKPEFLAISPNNRMPAIIDPNGPGGKPISVFESGAILQYLGRKTGKFYPTDERKRAAVEEWLFWQIAGVGPMAGQAHHFRSYAPEKIPYAIERYTREVGRLYGIIDKRVAKRDFLAGEFSIADIAVYPWAKLWERQGQDINLLPNFARWLERVKARPAVARGMAVRVEEKVDLVTDVEARKILFGIGAK
jgi:GST-like protein